MTQPASRTFPGRRDQVSRARAFVRDALDGCPRLDDAVLLTSELCANAVQHSQSGNGGDFDVTVCLLTGGVLIEVCDDGSGDVPLPRGFDDHSESGRGLQVIACLADRWGQFVVGGMRCVYFELRWDPAIWPQELGPVADGPEKASEHASQRGGSREHHSVV